MMKEYTYRIAGFTVTLSAPKVLEVDCLLPSFRPFRCVGCSSEAHLFRFLVEAPECRQQDEGTLVEESVNDFGHVRLLKTVGGYRIEVRATANGVVHCVHTDDRFTLATALLHRSDPRAGEVLCSMLRIVFSQAVLCRGGISLHASAVALNGKAYLFMGKSGTGKSTHAALWLRCFPGSSLLNDDNPVVCIVDGQAVAYGTPWSGKTPCYKNESFALGGIVRLVQAGANRFIPQEGVDAFITVLPGCSVIHKDTKLHEQLCNTLVRLTAQVPVGVLECLPDEEAARLCAARLS